MALKDMKSDLSKFRMPKNTPLESKERVDVNKNLNKTPLSSMTESAPKIPRSQTTTNKEGVNPQKVNQAEKFKGETTPKPMDNSEKFKGETTPKPMSLVERYLGQTDPQLVDQSEKFKGETTPTEVNQSEKFKGETTPKEMNNSENFLGETTPKEMKNSEQFLGETTPKPMSLEERFLGQTTPTEMNNSEQFLGETTPVESDRSSKFLGETTPVESDRSSKFLGETTPTEMNNSEQFLGETTPNEMNNSTRFLGETTPTEMNIPNGEKPLGETTPNESDRSSKFLGETTPNESDRSSKFLGETTPTPMNIPNGERGLGETTPISAEPSTQFLGETTPTDFGFKKKLENEGKDFKEVNYFTDIHTTGFNSKFSVGETTKFIGVNPNNTIFDSTNSLYSNFGDSISGLSFRAGYGKFKRGKETGNTQRYNPDTKYYTDSQLANPSISKLQEMRSSPSFLDEMYSKFNLRDDAFNLGTAAFSHPLILRGIQRKPIDKGEPQKWGFGFPIDDGLVRGGIVTAVDRSIVDAVRLGKWMISVNGLLWGIKNVGLQATNPNVETVTGKRLTKTWTPINTIASSIGGFIGLRPKRHGITPFDPPVETYSATQSAKKVSHIDDITLGVPILGNRLVQLYNETFTITPAGIGNSKFVGEQFNTLLGNGGPNSLYGLIPNGKVPSRGVSTLSGLFTGYTIQNQYNPLGTDPSTGPTAGAVSSLPFDRDNSDIGTEIKPYTEFIPESVKTPTSDPNFNKNETAGIVHNDERTYEENRSSELQGGDYEGNDLGLIWESYTEEGRASDGALNRAGSHTSKDTPFEKLKNTDGETHNIEKLTSSELIKGYETIAYGKIPTRVAGDTEVNDFRSLLDGDGKKRADKAGYTDNSLQSKFGFTNPGKVGADRTDYNTSHAVDPIQSGAINAAEQNDLVKLIFDKHGGGSKLQFRGAVSGITETFSPSWEGMKYNGRADSAFKYSTFERSISFNFKVYPTSKAELKPLYSKLQRLSTMTMPDYGAGTDGYGGILLDFTLGKLWVKHLSFIDSLSYTFSDDVPWDIDEGASMGIDVAIGLKLLSNVVPEYNSKVYDLGGI